ncbi:hypothetical protein [Mycolicibacterium farcinogenes]|uniref:Uncharacterized protein n=1 Tax=Mycolicibacterium farcinogenes TaxID=1802 RepID=A0ACD1FR59_MYCFR|nr:hypothetical protein [Mycolicibacterium farcinogenes]QZH69539.1 hypothetical protein K6L26_31010 [Mycolicibacterium farcinogenes]
MTATHPPLTAEDFNTEYYAEHRYIFIDDEGANMLYTYGHDRDEEFARQANEFDIEILGLDADEAQRTADDVHHRWAIVIEPKPEWRFTWVDAETGRGIEESTPGAFPISLIYR